MQNPPPRQSEVQRQTKKLPIFYFSFACFIKHRTSPKCQSWLCLTGRKYRFRKLNSFCEIFFFPFSQWKVELISATPTQQAFDSQFGTCFTWYGDFGWPDLQPSTGGVVFHLHIYSICFHLYIPPVLKRYEPCLSEIVRRNPTAPQKSHLCLRVSFLCSPESLVVTTFTSHLFWSLLQYFTLIKTLPDWLTQDIKIITFKLKE